jgi:hypothetical protein
MRPATGTDNRSAIESRKGRRGKDGLRSKGHVGQTNGGRAIQRTFNGRVQIRSVTGQPQWRRLIQPVSAPLLADYGVFFGQVGWDSIQRLGFDGFLTTNVQVNVRNSALIQKISVATSPNTIPKSNLGRVVKWSLLFQVPTFGFCRAGSNLACSYKR